MPGIEPSSCCFTRKAGKARWMHACAQSSSSPSCVMATYGRAGSAALAEPTLLCCLGEQRGQFLPAQDARSGPAPAGGGGGPVG
jgi:hypothetical protein